MLYCITENVLAVIPKQFFQIISEEKNNNSNKNNKLNLHVSQ